MRAIADRFGFSWPMPKEVKDADNAMLFVEKDQLMAGLSWEDDKSSAEAREREAQTRKLSSQVRIACYRPEVIEKIFLQKFYELT